MGWREKESVPRSLRVIVVVERTFCAIIHTSEQLSSLSRGKEKWDGNFLSEGSDRDIEQGTRKAQVSFSPSNLSDNYALPTKNMSHPHVLPLVNACFSLAQKSSRSLARSPPKSGANYMDISDAGATIATTKSNDLRRYAANSVNVVTALPASTHDGASARTPSCTRVQETRLGASLTPFVGGSQALQRGRYEAQVHGHNLHGLLEVQRGICAGIRVQRAFRPGGQGRRTQPGLW